ncbi:MAG: NAD(P)-dependent glycerol-3-phosphate dehydrogenase [Nanoarchaeota archaeon]|nr:NAD(P)-dependent glycerol-3-phosphate dehydrogenase [Nanoarchaeota archaeon]MBU1005054.1 NAD(P)-dependent glycerol-3-phosphate dehydrogenase [Nanoarchaeota archaeon]MBU1946559.1 NAD(P)-dependent glycerol-3-phosphate dehydrogenase [Nanoarchaeota archaeon]
MNISVIGAGGWGTTLANLLAEKGYKVKIWAFEKEVVEEINNKRENSGFLKGVKLSSNIEATNDLKEAVSDKDMIITAIPSSFLRNVAKEISKYISANTIIVSVTKGLEDNTFKRMSQIIGEEIPKVKVVALSGPNHAEEVARKVPSATVIASKHLDILPKVKEVLQTEYFKVYPHDDVAGIEICGAIKNITAIAVGVCDALKLGDNTKASIITLGLTEMSRVGRFFGAKRATFYGLAGVGDLVATCTSKHSRNRFVGERLAEGKSFEEIRKEMHGMVAEGIKTSKAVHDLALRNNIDLPLTNQVYKVLYEEKELKKAIKDLTALI